MTQRPSASTPKRDPDEHLKASLKALYAVHASAPGVITQAMHNATIAQCGLDKDLGLVGEWHHTYELDEDTRDRLLAHGRQDAAHAVLNTASLLDEVQLLRRQVRRLTNMAIWTLILLVLVLVVVFLRR